MAGFLPIDASTKIAILVEFNTRRSVRRKSEKVERMSQPISEHAEDSGVFSQRVQNAADALRDKLARGWPPPGYRRKLFQILHQARRDLKREFSRGQPRSIW